MVILTSGKINHTTNIIRCSSIQSLNCCPYLEIKFSCSFDSTDSPKMESQITINKIILPLHIQFIIAIGMQKCNLVLNMKYIQLDAIVHLAPDMSFGCGARMLLSF